MVFSFFKKKQSSPPSKQKSRGYSPGLTEPSHLPSHAEEIELTDLGSSPFKAQNSIEVLESTDEINAAIEEAAILYANEQLEEAVNTLIKHINENQPTHHSIELWLMLFELYQVQDNREAFDNLAIQFVVKFERSSPIWRNDDQKLTSKPAKIGQGKPYYALPETVDLSYTAQLKQLQQIAQKGGGIRIDFSKIRQIDSQASQILLEVLKNLRKKSLAPQLIGAPSLISNLLDRIEIMHKAEEDIPFWLLLLELYQLEGLKEAFESSAVDYAVTYEVSPPSWEALAVKSSEPIVLEESPATLDCIIHIEEDILFLAGILVGGESVYLNQIKDYGETRKTIKLDITKLTRIDFISAGALLNLLLGFKQNNKPIIIIGTNELVMGLLRIMGISELATFIKK